MWPVAKSGSNGSTSVETTGHLSVRGLRNAGRCAICSLCMARQLSVPFAGERVTTSTRRTWLRLTTSGAVLFGPGRAALIYAGRRGDRRLLHTVERRWARTATAALGMQIDIRGLELVDPGERYVVTPLHESFADALCLLRLPLDLTHAWPVPHSIGADQDPDCRWAGRLQGSVQRGTTRI